MSHHQSPHIPITRVTRQQRAILAALTTAARPLTPEEILSAASRQVATLSIATVYRVVRRLIDAGEVATVELPGEPARYELQSAADDHHHHFRCDQCDRVYDLPGCPGNLTRLLPPGFTLTGHDILLYGRCDDCPPDPRSAPHRDAGDR